MEDIYMLHGEPVARYEQEQLVRHEATISQYIDLGTRQFKLKFPIDDQAKDLGKTMRFPQTALAVITKTYVAWIDSADARIINPFRVTITDQSPEQLPRCGVSEDGETLPEVIFLPVDPKGAVFAKTGDYFCAVAHHSMDSYAATMNGVTHMRQSKWNGYYGIITTFHDIDTAQQAATDLLFAVQAISQPAASPYRSDPVQYVAPEPTLIHI